MPLQLQWRQNRKLQVAKEQSSTTLRERSWFRKATSLLTIGTTLATGLFGVNCVSDKPKSAAVKKQPETIQSIAKTDETGKAVFNINGRELSITVYDSEKLEPINGLVALLSLTNDRGIYILLDPQDRYFAQIFSINLSSEQISNNLAYGNDSVTDALSLSQISNVVLQKKEHVCGFESYQQITGMGIDELYRDRLNPDGILISKFEQINKDKTIRLSDLDDVLKSAISQTLTEVTQAEAERRLGQLAVKVAVWLGVSIPQGVSIAGEAVNFMVSAINMCASLEQQEWVRYYRSLCYSDNDEFEIWKLKGFPEVRVDLAGVDAALLSNPVLLVLPKQKSGDWHPGIAKIDGTVNAPSPWLAASMPQVQLQDTSGQFPSVSAIPWYNEGVGGYFPSTTSNSGNFSFVAGACGETTYDLRVKSIVPGFEPETQLTASEGDEYNVEFRIGLPFCSYSTYYKATADSTCGDKFNIAVACERPGGYVTSTTCNSGRDGGSSSDGGARQEETQNSVDGGAVNALLNCNLIHGIHNPNSLSNSVITGKRPNDGYPNYAYIATGEVSPLPEAWGRGVAWNDNIVYYCQRSGGHEGICVFDTVRREVIRFDERFLSSYDLVIQGNRMVFIQGHFGKIMNILNLDNWDYETSTPLVEMTEDPWDGPWIGNPQIFGNKIAVTTTHDNPELSPEVSIYDIASRTFTDTGINNCVYGYSIYENTLLVTGCTDGQMHITKYDILTGNRIVITPDFNYVAGPYIWGSKALFVGQFRVGDVTDVYMIDLATSTINLLRDNLEGVSRDFADTLAIMNDRFIVASSGSVTGVYVCTRRQ